MPTPRYSIRTIAEQSVKAWFDANAALLPGTPVVVGQTDSERSVPIIIIHAESARGAKDLGAYWLGNFELTVKIYVYSSADDAATKDQALQDHRARCEAVQAIMMDVPGLQASWTQGKLYMSKFDADDEGVADRRYGNIMQYSLTAVYPPA
jgi:hypothetical protein